MPYTGRLREVARMQSPAVSKAPLTLRLHAICADVIQDVTIKHNEELFGQMRARERYYCSSVGKVSTGYLCAVYA